MAKLLIISALQIFPERSGGQMRTGSIARGLAAAGHEVQIFSFIGRKDDLLRRRQPFSTLVGPGLEEFVDTNPVRGLLATAGYRIGLPPLWVSAERKMHTPEKLKKLLTACDFIIWDFPFSFAEFDLGHKKPVILSTHNVEGALWNSGFFGKWIKEGVTKLEEQALRKANLVCCCSENDMETLRQISPDTEFILVPNGIDITRFNLPHEPKQQLRRSLRLSEDKKIFLFAASAYGPNIEGLQLLRSYLNKYGAVARQMGVHFLVVGSVSKTQEQSELITVTGKVDVIEPYFSAADFALNPVLTGSGTSLKLAEYIGARLPVLTTTVGARGYKLTVEKSAWFFNDIDTLHAQIQRAVGAANLTEMTQSAFNDNVSIVDSTRTVDPLLRWLNETGMTKTSGKI